MNRALATHRLTLLACTTAALLGAVVVARADDASPAAKAKALLARQLARDDDGTPPAVASDAMVFTRTAEARTGDGTGPLTAAPGKPVVGATADAAWIVADLIQPYELYDCPPSQARCHRKRPVRISELAVDTGKGWQVVAAHVQSKAKGGAGTDDLPATTAPGPLTAWLADPGALDAALADRPDVVVLGTEAGERAVGKKAAHKLLGSWRTLKLTIAGAPREVRQAHWGYAAANGDWTRKPGDVVHMRATVLATSTDGTTWTAVVAHYSLSDPDE